MPSITRTIFVLVHAVAFAALVGMSFLSTPAVGSPLPLPVWKSYMDLAQRSALTPRTMESGHHLTNTTTLPGHTKHDHDVKAATSLAAHKRQINTNTLDNLDLLNTYYTQINENANTIDNLGSVAGQQQGGNSDFNQQYATALSAFHTNFLGFQTTLAELAADKGLANYDKNDAVETLLKGVVNDTKNILSTTDQLVANIPGLGPILGPIVYEVKCLIDEVLDATENLTDALINVLAPLLRALVGQATQTACDAGIQIAGICIPL